MTFSGYLVFKKLNHYRGSARYCKTKPKVDSNEVSMRVNFDIPDALFTRPVLEADIKIPDISTDALKVDPKICSDVEQAFREKGIEININLPSDKNE